MTEERAQYLINYADGFYKRFGAPDNIHGLNDKRIDEIKYEASRHNIRLIPCPVRHLGTEQAFDVLEEMYNHLIKSGNLTFMELTEALDIIVEDGLAKGVIIKQRDKEEEQVLGKYIIAAPGRGGAQWLSEQTKKLSIQTLNNAVDIGVRVEVPNSIMDHLTRIYMRQNWYIILIPMIIR